MEPIKNIVTVMMLSLRRRYLEHFIDGPFKPTILAELDAVITEQERLTEGSETTEREL